MKNQGARPPMCEGQDFASKNIKTFPEVKRVQNIHPFPASIQRHILEANGMAQSLIVKKFTLPSS